MLNDSPADYGTSLDDLVEEEESSPTPAEPPLSTVNKDGGDVQPASNRLAADLGMDENPLKEKKVGSNVKVKAKTVEMEAKRYTAKEKGKGKAEALTVTNTNTAATRNRTSGSLEKENQVKAKSGGRISSSSFSSAGSVSSSNKSNLKAKGNAAPSTVADVADGRKVAKPVLKSASSGTGTTKIGVLKLAAGRGGPRRVPIDSAEAATVETLGGGDRCVPR